MLAFPFSPSRNALKCRPQTVVRGQGFMRGPKIAGIVVGAVLVIGALLYFVVFKVGGPAFEKSFNESFLENCLTSATDTARKAGRTGPEVDTTIRRQCNCALDIVKPLSIADKAALEGSEEKQRELIAEIQRRCQ